MSDVSVLIPAYNCALTIGRAVRSAVKPEGVSIEACICHDDGPAESWEAICGAVIDSAGNARAEFHEQNRGPGAALQTAASIARGRYFIMLGDDDWLEPGCLKPLVEALDWAPNRGFSFAYGCTKYWGMRSDLHVPAPFRADDFYQGFPSLYGYLYRREVWERGTGYRDEFLREERWLGSPDWDMALQCLEYGAGLCLPDVVVLNHLLMRGRMWDTVSKHGADVVASMKERHPKLEATGL